MRGWRHELRSPATAARAREPHCCVGAAAANDALEPTLTRGRDRLQATRWPTKARRAVSRTRHLAVESILFLSFCPFDIEVMVSATSTAFQMKPTPVSPPVSR